MFYKNSEGIHNRIGTSEYNITLSQLFGSPDIIIGLTTHIQTQVSDTLQRRGVYMIYYPDCIPGDNTHVFQTLVDIVNDRIPEPISVPDEATLLVNSFLRIHRNGGILLSHLHENYVRERNKLPEHINWGDRGIYIEFTEEDEYDQFNRAYLWLVSPTQQELSLESRTDGVLHEGNSSCRAPIIDIDSKQLVQLQALRKAIRADDWKNLNKQEQKRLKNEYKQRLENERKQ